MSDDLAPGALSLEDASPNATIDGPSANQEPAEDDVSTVDVKDGKVDVGVLVAERKRAKEATAKAKDEEYAPLKAKAEEADRLRQSLAETQPYIDYLRQHPELLEPPKPTPLEEQIGGEEAASEARDLELYDAKTGQPDLPRAKRIIARRRTDALAAAQAATQAAIGPITSQTALQTSRQNFVQIASRRDAQGRAIVDPKALAEVWAQLDPALTAHPEVGELLVDLANGKRLRSGQVVPRPEREPQVSEPAGGRSGPQWQMDRMAKSLAASAGMSEKEFAAGAKGYQPGSTNVIGE